MRRAERVPLPRSKVDQRCVPDAADQDRAFSVYFCDPWGHRLEVTTYDAAYVRERLG